MTIIDLHLFIIFSEIQGVNGTPETAGLPIIECGSTSRGDFAIIVTNRYYRQLVTLKWIQLSHYNVFSNHAY